VLPFANSQKLLLSFLQYASSKRSKSDQLGKVIQSIADFLSKPLNPKDWKAKPVSFQIIGKKKVNCNLCNEN